MTQTHGPRRRPLIVAAALAAIGVAVLAAVAIAAGPNDRAAGTPDRGSVACHHADEPAADLTTKQLRKAVRCLANEERAGRGLGKLKRVRSLQKASQKHAKTMARTDCLAHKCPHEDDLETRLRKAGYFEGARSWHYAENTGCGLSAQAMFSNWMASTYHRINIVEEEFREIGVGVVSERVKRRCKKGYATFAAVFGRREGL